jgi:hypothetical protein
MVELARRLPWLCRMKTAAPIGAEFLTLAGAVDVHRTYREIAIRIAEPDVPELPNPDDAFSPTWFPITGPQLPIVVDCADPGQGLARRDAWTSRTDRAMLSQARRPWARWSSGGLEQSTAVPGAGTSTGENRIELALRQSQS